MPTDDERRAVAARLREIDARGLDMEDYLGRQYKEDFRCGKETPPSLISCPHVLMADVPVFAGAEPSKAQAAKIAEECCEVYSAWEDCRGDGLADPALLRALMDECADVIQATCNLAWAAMRRAGRLETPGGGDLDFGPYQAACTRRNEQRGRY